MNTKIEIMYGGRMVGELQKEVNDFINCREVIDIKYQIDDWTH